jgi:hypothetical protein
MNYRFSTLFRLLPEFRRLEAENAELEEQLSKAVAGELTIIDLAISQGRTVTSLGTKIATSMAEAFLALLDERGAPNYVEITLAGPSIGEPMSVVIHRPGAKSPATLHREALKRIAELEKELGELRPNPAVGKSWSGVCQAADDQI